MTASSRRLPPGRTTVAALTLTSLTSLGLLAGCKKAPEQQAPPPAPVQVVAVEERAVEVPLTYMARTAGIREVEVRARVSGILLRRMYEEGSHVQQGALLFRIDPAQYQAEASRAKAQLTAEEARYAEAKRQRERAVPLLEKKAISQRDYDQAIASAESAEAAVAGARANYERTQLDLSYTEVRAPIAGLTSREARSEGSLVTAGADSSLLTRIVQTDKLYVEFSVPASEAALLRTVLAGGRKTLTVKLETADGKPFAQTGELQFIDSAVDQASGTVLARATLPNPDKQLLPGQFLRAHIEGVTLPKAAVVPSRSVVRMGGGTMVMVVGQDNKVEPRPVQLGDTAGNEVLVLSGLKHGEHVIANGVMKAMPGSAVMPILVDKEGAPVQAPGQPQGQAQTPGGKAPAQDKASTASTQGN